ncbi:MAG: hypothetical protein Q9184_005678 [Pyrenodesmia sp. 2 TL-2023]
MPPASPPITWPIVSLRASNTDELAAALTSLRAAHPNLTPNPAPNSDGFILDPETGIQYIINCPPQPLPSTSISEREQRYQSICRKREEWAARRGRERGKRDRSASPRSNDTSQVGWDKGGYPVWPGERFPKEGACSERAEGARGGLLPEGMMRVEEWVQGVEGEIGEGESGGVGRGGLSKRMSRRPERYRD